MDTIQRIQSLAEARGWTAYRLHKECGLSESTIRNIYQRNTTPSIQTLEIICQAFGISLAQFFAEEELMECTPEMKRLLQAWHRLTPEQKEAHIKLMETSQPQV